MTSTDTDSNPAQDATEKQEKLPLTMEVTVEAPGACERHVVVSISRADVTRYQKEAFDEMMPQAEVPGFRPGRAPRKLIESRFKDQVSDQVKGSLLMDALTQVSEEQDFSAISEPDFDFDAVSLPDDGPFTFEFDIEVRPEFDVPKWDGLALNRPTRDFTDDDVDRRVQRLLRRFSKLKGIEGDVIARGDQLEVKLTTSCDGQVVNDETSVSVAVLPTLSLRDGRINNFDQLMAGAKEGETRTTTVELSQDAENEAVRGKEVEVAFEITAAQRLVPPELDAAFLESIGGFEDEDDLKEVVRGEMQRQLGFHQTRQFREQISAELTKDANWELPPDLVRRQARRELERMVLELRSSGFSDEDIQEHANDIRRNGLESTERFLKQHFIFERIAEDEKIEADPDDYDDEVRLIADQQDESPRRVRARLEKRGQMDALRNQIIERKVVDLICSRAEFTEVSYDPFESEDVAAINFALGGSTETAEIPEAKHGGDAQELQKPPSRS